MKELRINQNKKWGSANGRQHGLPMQDLLKAKTNDTEERQREMAVK
jgi:hypothetical protein